MTTLNQQQLKPRAHSSMIMDENKIPAKVSLGMGASGVEPKKPMGLGLKTQRGALSDLTNNTVSGPVGIQKSNTANIKTMIMPQSSNSGIISRLVNRSKSAAVVEQSSVGANLRSSAMISGISHGGHLLKVAKHDISSNSVMEQQPVCIDDDMMMEDDGAMMVEAVQQEQPEDIDRYDAHDPQCVGEYVNDIFAYYRQKEIADRIEKDYLKNQHHINEKMRAILVDWLMAVHVRFKLLSETFFLSVNIVDRYLSKVPITINRLQLVGITASLLACKYEEIYAPQIDDFIQTSDNACTHEDVLNMERSILSKLQFHVSTCTPLHFLRRFSKAAGSDSRTHSLSKYLTELAMTEYNMVQYLPSMIAASAIYVSRRMTMKSGPYWNVTLEYYTCYKEADIMQCAQDLKEVRKRADNSSLRATKKKYTSSKLMEVSNIPVVEF
ncbi:hypothetical protein CYY_006077 [Polysphondylium violaceum]|uniref:Cyclin N-terminal domain-containing protein n=1 Tax=Polysphondylium violaceum TaxID=133409 RepID=A0A8J4PR32_9MYCE|nr:hypothetical protein CYY_006077 [Polysphondylium violaceum]